MVVSPAADHIAYNVTANGFNSSEKTRHMTGSILKTFLPIPGTAQIHMLCNLQKDALNCSLFLNHVLCPQTITPEPRGCLSDEPLKRCARPGGTLSLSR